MVTMKRTLVSAILLSVLFIVHGNYNGKEFCQTPDGRANEETSASDPQPAVDKQNDVNLDSDRVLDNERSSCRGEDGLAEGEKATDTESSNPQPKFSLHAETNSLSAGSWCVGVDYSDLGPRLLAVAWFLYGRKAAYSVLRSETSECPPISQGSKIDVTTETPFTIHFNFIPGIQEFGKENVRIQPGECEAPDRYIRLDGSHGDRLLTCNFQGDVNLSLCKWQSEQDPTTEDPGSVEAQWVQDTDKLDFGSADDSVDGGGDKDDSQTGRKGGKGDVSEASLSSPPLTIRAQPGCLHLWLYAWGRVPAGLTVYLQQDREGADRQVLRREVKLPEAGLITWKEERIAVDFTGPFGITVEIHAGDGGWTGSLVLDDISTEGVACTDTTPHYHIIPTH